MRKNVPVLMHSLIVCKGQDHKNLPRVEINDAIISCNYRQQSRIDQKLVFIYNQQQFSCTAILDLFATQIAHFSAHEASRTRRPQYYEQESYTLM